MTVQPAQPDLPRSERRSPQPCSPLGCGFGECGACKEGVPLLEVRPVCWMGGDEGKSALIGSGLPRPSGLPLLSTAVLTPDERTLIRQLGITCQSAAALIEDATSVDDGCGRVDRSLHALDFIAQLGDRARALMATLGSGRQ